VTYTWVEPFAGAAAIALRIVGGPHLVPPVSWMGGKRKLAPFIADAMGVPRSKPSRVVFCDAGPWGRVWPALLEETAEVAELLRYWEQDYIEDGRGPRMLWDSCRDRPPHVELHARAAQWLWLQARSASGVPVWWSGDRYIADTGSGEACQKGDNSRSPSSKGWRMGEEPSKARRGARTISQTGGAQQWLASDGRGVERPVGQKGEERPDRLPSGGMVHPATIADRIEAIAHAIEGIAVAVHHGDAADLFGVVEQVHDPRDQLFVYLDPPYVGCTGYGWTMPREQVVELAKRWQDAGAVVAVSEAEALDLEGWHHLDLTRHGNGKPEWLTLSRAPARVPAVQLDLLGAP